MHFLNGRSKQQSELATVQAWMFGTWDAERVIERSYQSRECALSHPLGPGGAHRKTWFCASSSLVSTLSSASHAGEEGAIYSCNAKAQKDAHQLAICVSS
jgi:hypothetical protein